MVLSQETISDEYFGKLRQKFHVNPNDYKILRGENQGVRNMSSVWDTDFTLSEYVKYTDHIIGLLDGSITDRAVDAPGHENLPYVAPDSVIYLDKSARPVSWLVDALWDECAADDAKRPDVDFLNIDRVNWFIREGYDSYSAAARLGPEDFHIERVPQRDISRIRALFVVGGIEDFDNWEQEVLNKPTTLDGREVLIIDEVKNKGGTLAIACQLLARAIPEATFSGDYFWQAGRYSLDPNAHEMQMMTAPVWYDNKSALGRGIGDIKESYYELLYDKDPSPRNLQMMIGAHVLSAPHHRIVSNTEVDQASGIEVQTDDIEYMEDNTADQLREDIIRLSQDVIEGRVLRWPSRRRSADNMLEIIKSQVPSGYTIRDLSAYRERLAQINN